MDIVAQQKIRRFESGGFKEIASSVATEYPLTIYVNEIELVTIVCTPEFLEDLVVGFLTSEGIIRGPGDIDTIDIIESTGHAKVTANFVNKFNAKYRGKRYITSCCGKSRENFYFQSDASLVNVKQNTLLHLTTSEIFRLMEKFEADSATFHQTGGVHNAALCDSAEIIYSRMDIGRHNALDKIYGRALQDGTKTENKAIIFSGRISSEILVKTAKLGCGIILSRSAPTELAINMAEELHITTVGFIRGDRLNVYSGLERII
ncbi:formate dehydrogenase accessory sulfurtransferase FdhD [Listeria seeligeri]|uniref:formate dehydrogenase accessory sulfurtransferase FdhD n=1 Tax=Listeria seeligeri TaxID=1640 RepID=UPI001624C43E|nr:formate dehydrogenase accessory sulfurtransferase FdhD [Listeria seeligeri]MBC1824795.1 formate dehydrogenase accessory sulfurtransferase FdhD [Listeria seeligeri]MBC1838797.1 formate dehydrogenase accessory sulfurtransferase FdhD [Listeria seeligeri]MBF2360887.1 formate dehydrogenase accessory sulfurtransferase FdhD [Listeria seeligeri]MBF2498051.1 formate dehydrogenase accessory sulfurtransferase FdhD [Listeria seeligeri]MBF2542103.1 formate dehydrogenase accessory sulfurtransferase FdhD 